MVSARPMKWYSVYFALLDYRKDFQLFWAIGIAAVWMRNVSERARFNIKACLTILWKVVASLRRRALWEEASFSFSSRTQSKQLCHCHNLLPFLQFGKQGAKWTWTETSETISRKNPFLSISWLHHVCYSNGKLTQLLSGFMFQLLLKLFSPKEMHWGLH